MNMFNLCTGVAMRVESEGVAEHTALSFCAAQSRVVLNESETN